MIGFAAPQVLSVMRFPDIGLKNFVRVSGLKETQMIAPGLTRMKALRAAYKTGKGYQYVIFEVGPTASSPAGWNDRDSFVPRLEAAIKAAQAMPGVNDVFLRPVMGPRSSPALFREGVLPLVRQAARETQAKLLLSGSEPGSKAAFYEDMFAFQTRLSNKQGWKVVAADCFEPGGEPSLAIDGDPNTFWHTQYSPKDVPPPHFIEIDLGKQRTFAGFRYLPRQDGGSNGRIGQYQFFVQETKPVTYGLTETNWVLVNSGTLKSTSHASIILFAHPVSARYIRLVTGKDAQGGPWTSIAELDVLPVLTTTR